MARHPIVLVHGHSNLRASFGRWADALEARGHDVAAIHTCHYKTLTNAI